MSPMAGTTTDVDKRILLLTGKKYRMWAFCMKARLMKKGLWHFINIGPTADEKQEECDAFDFLVSTISVSILSGVIDAKDEWEKLRKLYASTDASIIVAIEDEIHRLKYASGAIEDHSNEFRLLIARHKSAGGDMSATSAALPALRTN
jgi:hypothetical protein